MSVQKRLEQLMLAESPTEAQKALAKLLEAIRKKGLLTPGEARQALRMGWPSAYYEASLGESLLHDRMENIYDEYINSPKGENTPRLLTKMATVMNDYLRGVNTRVTLYHAALKSDPVLERVKKPFTTATARDGKPHEGKIFFDDDSFIATINDMPGCSAFGPTRAEALAEIEVALDLHLECIEEDG